MTKISGIDQKEINYNYPTVLSMRSVVIGNFSDTAFQFGQYALDVFFIYKKIGIE